MVTSPEDVLAPEVVKPEPPSHSFLFHHEGAFDDGETIVKGYNFGEESTLKIDQVTSDKLKPPFLERVAKYLKVLPQQEIFPNGLSRQQAAEVLALQETYINFNGGLTNEHSVTRNTNLYSKANGEPVPLSEFEGKCALTCVEASALTQQVLSGSQEMTYVSGSADLNGKGIYEMHSFNMTRPADKRYAVTIIDISNPTYIQLPDGSLNVKVFCSPITQEQFDNFRNNQPIEVDASGTKRLYKTGGKFVW
ncbi:MAG: hypothetical protein WCK31_01880 [bacterium]